ncbi:hypothetical protein CRG98_031906, partial [Punica granatum]
MEALLARADALTVPLGRPMEARRPHDHGMPRNYNSAAYRTFPPRRTAYPIASSGSTPHPRPPQDSYISERFTVNGTLAPYDAFTSPSIPSTKSEHSPPHQHTWLNSIHRDRRRRNGPRPSRLPELHLQSPLKPKAPPERLCVQSYSPSRRNEIDSVASLLTLVRRSRTTGSFRRSWLEQETIRALQANDVRPDARYGDCSLFPGMRLPPKFEVPEFKTYEGTTDPRHHLRHYRGKMLQYWEYEEFVIHFFQDSLVTFQVLDIPNAFSLLLGRPWIHSARAIPSSLHQKVKFIVEEKIITVKGEEDYAIYKETAVPYISVGDDENLPFHSFGTISVIRDYGEVGPSRTDRMIGKEEVVKQINAGFLEVCNYSEWVANIVPVEKIDGRVRVYVDYRDLNKASPKDNFPLPHIDIL